MMDSLNLNAGLKTNMRAYKDYASMKSSTSKNYTRTSVLTYGILFLLLKVYFIEKSDKNGLFYRTVET
jgi:hypothetical protein